MDYIDFLRYILLPILAAIPTIGLIIYVLNRPKRDKRVDGLAQKAYECAADIMGVEAKGKPPAVSLKNAPWDNVVGRYTYRRMFGFLWYEQIEVVDDVSYIFSNLVHEMTHVLLERAGMTNNEILPEATEAAADKHCAGPELDELLRKFN